MKENLPYILFFLLVMGLGLFLYLIAGWAISLIYYVLVLLIVVFSDHV